MLAVETNTKTGKRSSFIPFQAGQTTAWSMFRDFVPSIADDTGAFKIKDAQAYLESQGVKRGTAASAIFAWSDDAPGMPVGYRRFRRMAPRRGASTPPEPIVKNDLKDQVPAEIAAEAEKVKDTPRKARTPETKPRRPSWQVDRMFFQIVGRVMSNTGSVHRADFVREAVANFGHEDNATLNQLWMRKAKAYMTRVSRGVYELNDRGWQRFSQLAAGDHRKAKEKLAGLATPPVNTEAVNDRIEEPRSFAAEKEVDVGISGGPKYPQAADDSIEDAVAAILAQHGVQTAGPATVAEIAAKDARIAELERELEVANAAIEKLASLIRR